MTVPKTFVPWNFHSHIAKCGKIVEPSLLRHIFTHHTEHSGLCKGTLISVFLCPITDILAMVAPTSVKFCMIAHIGPGQIFSPFRGSNPKGSPKSEILAL